MRAHPFQERLWRLDPVLRTGRVRRILATHIEATGPSVSLGTLCRIEARSVMGPRTIQAEVVRVDEEGIVLSPFESGYSTWSGATVTACGQDDAVPVGDAFLGRAVDPLGQPIDEKGALHADSFRSLLGATISPLDRVSPHKRLETGIRAIDGLLTLGEGQRVGLFAASGVGKTTLMSQIAQQTRADITVICLVGERGREVEDLWNRGLNAEARTRATMVAATSDLPAAMRVRAGHYALALAEHWRAQGRHVLLLLDSATRLAMAMREIGLAAGEPPTVRAYTPSVFAAIPRIVERCGALRSGGAITSIMTVLSETDEMDDPVCEMMKSLLDGHILLSRSIAERGHFPAIDVPRSISRLASGLIPDTARSKVQRVVEWLSLHESSRTLVETGLYAKGSNREIDEAIERHPAILSFLKQDRASCVGADATMAALDKLAGGRR